MLRFRRLVWRYYRLQGRHDLPWRKTRNLYKILVSEVMLQQTRVERVIPFYTIFIKRFPTPEKLAHAPLSAVLQSWQGLGYNRRAKMLHACAKEIITTRWNLAARPDLVAALEKLPGVGSYTARATAVFTYNQDAVFIETNIRTSIIHHFFPKKKNVSDKDIGKVLLRTLPKGRAREWYSALMDYGAYLKRTGISHNVRSTTYVKQERFAGSLREARGAIVRACTEGITSRARLVSLLGPSRRGQMEKALEALRREGLITGNLL
jgi:A/G-specific adenine glycosylase